MIDEQFNDREQLNGNEITILRMIDNGAVVTMNHKIDHIPNKNKIV